MATIATNSTLLVNAPLYLEALNANVIVNAGTITWTSGDFYLGASSVLTNLPGALFDAKLNGNVYFEHGGVNSFYNFGTFRKSAGSGSLNIAPNFINGGTIDAQTGVSQFSGSFINPAGTLAVSSGSTIQILQPVVLPAGSLITGSGTVQASSITSSGVVSPGATNAVLTLSGNYIQQVGGSMEELLTSAAQRRNNQSQVNVTGTATLNGGSKLRFSSAYSPAVGGSDVVLTAGAVTGQFHFQDYFLLLGQNKRMSAIYNPNNVTLTAIAAPDPTGPTLDVAVQNQDFPPGWPSEFAGYNLYVKTNLDDPTWTLIPGVTNFYAETPMTSPHKFFRLFPAP